MTQEILSRNLRLPFGLNEQINGEQCQGNEKET